eukprot:60539-Chlamydomonas_euryale.AAC.2
MIRNLRCPRRRRRRVRRAAPRRLSSSLGVARIRVSGRSSSSGAGAVAFAAKASRCASVAVKAIVGDPTTVVKTKQAFKRAVPYSELVVGACAESQAKDEVALAPALALARWLALALALGPALACSEIGRHVEMHWHALIRACVF